MIIIKLLHSIIYCYLDVFYLVATFKLSFAIFRLCGLMICAKVLFVVDVPDRLP